MAEFEAKTASAHTSREARHIGWLQDRLALDGFVGGVVFDTGPQPLLWLDSGIKAVPMCGLWAEGAVTGAAAKRRQQRDQYFCAARPTRFRLR